MIRTFSVEGASTEIIMRHKKVPKFLRDVDAAFSWAIKNVGDLENSIEELNEQEAGLGDDFYGRRASAYVYFAHDAYGDGTVQVHRAIRVPVDGNGVPLISFSSLGKAWSKTRGGAGVYGMVKEIDAPMKDIVLTGTVKPSDVDWEYGFTSFMYYGEDQWEVSMLPDSPVVITHIDDVLLDSPIHGNTGKAQESWIEIEA